MGCSGTVTSFKACVRGQGCAGACGDKAVQPGGCRAERGPGGESRAHFCVFFPQELGHWEHAGKADDAPSCPSLGCFLCRFPLCPCAVLFFLVFKAQGDSHADLICLTVKHNPSARLPSLTARAAALKRSWVTHLI